MYKKDQNLDNDCTVSKNRFEDGYRFDNSKYWKKYYESKLKGDNLGRERRYSSFLKDLVGEKSKALDVATGYGFLPLEMLKLGLDVTCCDAFDEMISEAKNYFSKNKYQINIVKADVTNLPFRKNQFDLVTAMSIMEHITLSESSKYFLPTIKKILKKDGYVLIHVPVKSCITKFKKFYRQSIIKDLPKWAVDEDGDVTHKIWLSVNVYINTLIGCGLKPRYVTFNFVRSNEGLFFMNWYNFIMSKINTKFHKITGNRLSFWQKIMSKLAVSCAFVCQ